MLRSVATVTVFVTVTTLPYPAHGFASLIVLETSPLSLSTRQKQYGSPTIFSASQNKCEISSVCNSKQVPTNKIRLKASSLDGADNSKESRDSGVQTTVAILNAALLVAGTTIGGGFLAIPAVVAPSGFYPSSIMLLAVWAYFLAESFILVECLDRAKTSSSSTSSPGVSAAARMALGSKGEAAIAVLLIVLTKATLVSQIARAGILFPSHYRAGCIVSALLIAAVVFGPRQGVLFASRANSVLVHLFLASACMVFGCGTRAADWQRLGVSSNWWSVPKAIPTFLQLLVYGEILPAVCELLGYQMTPIRVAIALGSFLTLVLQIAWSALGIGLMPISSKNVDPVNVLLATAGPVRIPLFCLAATAILTTILGSYLALLSSFQDIMRTTTRNSPFETTSSWRRRLMVTSVITIPSLAIACTSPSVFLNAIDFAGSYPVLLLWGVAPPAMALLLRRQKGVSSAAKSSSGSAAWIFTIGLLSLTMVGIHVKQDMSRFVGKVRGMF